MNIQEKNKELLIQYFQNGAKPNSKKIGVELEHIVIDSKTKESVSYYGERGIEKLIHQIAKNYPSFYRPEGRLIGVYNDDYSITLEPAGQFEVSISPQDQVDEIHNIYQSFLKIVNPVLSEWGYELSTLGYHPLSKVDDLKLIPKKRYEYMDLYFKTAGTCGKNMMKGTSATQVSIDYRDEEDFVLKIRVAYRLMPLLKILTDNTAIFEGEYYPGYLARTRIWNCVDNDRTGIIDGLFDADFGFEAYADYLMNLPLIFREESGNAVYTGKQTAKDLWKDEIFTKQDIEHVLSMNFQDVRLKHYLEIRYADGMPFSCVLAYASLLQTIFYDQALLSEIDQMMSHITTVDIIHAQEALMKDGLEAEVYGYPVTELLTKILGIADQGDQRLEPLWHVVKNKKTIAKEYYERNYKGI